MLKSINYFRSISSLFIFLLLCACGDNGGFFNKGSNGEKIVDPREAKLRKYYTRLEERKISLGLLRQDGGGADTPFDVEDITAGHRLKGQTSDSLRQHVLNLKNVEVAAIVRRSSETHII